MAFRPGPLRSSRSLSRPFPYSFPLCGIVHPHLKDLDHEPLPPAMLCRQDLGSSRETSLLPPPVLPPSDATALLDKAGPLPSCILLLGRCVGPHTVVCVAHSLATAAAREQYRSVADMALCHAYEAVALVLPDAGVNSGQGIFPNNLSCLARQLLAAIGTTEMFEGSIRRASRYYSLTSRLPGIHFPAPGRPRFFMAGVVDIIGIANAVLYCGLQDLTSSTPLGLTPCHAARGPRHTQHWRTASTSLGPSGSGPATGSPWIPCATSLPWYQSSSAIPSVFSMDEINGIAEVEGYPPSCPYSSPSGTASADEAPMRLYVDCWDTLLVRVFLRRVSVRNAMEVARQLALAAIAWDVPCCLGA